jgi:hypothetical protein
MRHKSILRLIITGFGTPPGEVSECIGLVPDRVWEAGQPRFEKNPAVRFVENGWRWTAPVEPVDATLDVLFAAVSNALDPLKFKRLPEQTRVELSYVCYAFDGMPELHLSPEQVALAASIGAAIDFDLYALDADAADRPFT